MLTQNGGIRSTQAEIAPQYEVWKLQKCEKNIFIAKCLAAKSSVLKITTLI
jgi:hypothetical protein